MSAIQTTITIPSSSPISLAKEKKHEVIKKIAITALKELAVGLAFAALACAFTNPIGVAVAIGGVVAIVALNILIRYVEAYSAKRLREIDSIHTPEIEKEKKFLKVTLKICNLLCASNFAIAYLGTAGTVVHEAGHAIVASALTTGKVSVSVSPWSGGVTKYLLGKLSSLGEYFGLKESKLIIAAAGAGFTLITSLLLFTVGHYLERSHPKLATYLNMMAIVGVLNETLYAIDALTSKNPSSGHDFYTLWQSGGLHPLISIAFLIVLPLLVKGMLLLADHLLKHTPKPATTIPLTVSIPA